MPIYEYKQKEDSPGGCRHCREGFDVFQPISSPALDCCPCCGGPVLKQISACSVGKSASSLDDRAKNAGFTKLKKLGKGEYERQY